MSRTESFVNWKLALAYALPNFGMAIMVGPVLGIIQGVYARDFGVAIAAMAGVVFLGRMFDAVSDPAVGITSDRLRKRFWGRRSWVVAGVILSLLSLYNLFIPPAGGMTIGHLRVWFILAFLGWTVCEIPYLAWGTEITTDYDQRTKLFSYKTAIGYLGAFAFVALPILIGKFNVHILGQAPADQTGDFTPLTLKVALWMLVILMPIFLVITLKVCPDGAHVKKRQKHTVKEAASALIGNKAMLIFSSAFILLGFAAGMQIATAYFHVSIYLKLGEHLSPIYMYGMIFNILGVPIWNWLAKRKGKHVAFMIGAAIMALFFLVFGIINPVPENAKLFLGKPLAFWQYLGAFIGLNLCQAVYYAIPPSIIGDIAEYGMLKTGQDQSGTYYSVYTFLYKTTIAIGNGAALYLIAKVFGFDAEATAQTALAGWGLKILMGFLPATLAVAAIVVLFWYPLNRKRYAEIEEEIHRLGLRTADKKKETSGCASND